MAPHPTYNREEVEGHKLEIQEILTILTDNTVAKSCMSLALHLLILYGMLILPWFIALS